MAKTTILHVSTAHQWDDIRIYHKECISLHNAGYDVQLLARANKDFISKDGLQIWAVPSSKSRAKRMLIQPWLLLQKIRAIKPKICHFHDPELLPLAMVLKMLGYKTIYDAHENLPDQILNKHWITDAARPLVATVAKILLRSSQLYLDHAVCATQTIADTFAFLPTSVVRNFPVLAQYAEIERSNYKGETPNGLYIGALSSERGLIAMLDALLQANQSQEFKLTRAGAFSSALDQQTAENHPAWQYVNFVGYINQEQLKEQFEHADFGLVVLQPNQAFLDSLPLKLFEYMASSLPVIASNFPFWRELLGGIDCAIFVDPNDTNSIANAMLKYAADATTRHEMGKIGREAVINTFNWQSESALLENCYTTVLHA